MLANTYQQGSGVYFLEAKLNPAIAKRIEWLGQMSDRVNACLAKGDNGGLLELAGEYAERGMLQTANRVALLARTDQKP